MAPPASHIVNQSQPNVPTARTGKNESCIT
jgi:hypothetical protein